MIGALFAFVSGGSATRLAATVLAGVALGGWGAWQVQGWRHEAQRSQAVQQQAADTLRQWNNRDRASATYQTEQASATQTHTQIIERVRIINARPAAAVQCLDADGLQQLGAAIDNGAPTTAAGSGADVPTPVPAR
jgi:uncharacterized protein HemX